MVTAEAARPSGAALLGPWARAVFTIWYRDLVVFRREKVRMAGMVGQPVLYLFILGTGINASMRLEGAPPGLDYLRFMFPGVVGMSLLFTSIFSAISIIWDREFGFLKEVLVAPVPRWGVALGKILGGATVATVQCVILLALAPLVGIGLSFAGVAIVLLLAFMTSLALTALGVAIAARMDSMQGFQMILNFLVMPLFFLSGAMFPVSLAPTAMRVVMAANPLTYGVDGIRTVLLGDTPMGSGSGSLLDLSRAAGLVRYHLTTDLAVLLIWALLLGFVAAVRFEGAEADR